MSAEKNAGHPCCPHCADALSDHAGHGGIVEKNGHDLPCSTCEYERRTLPLLAAAWDKGYTSGHSNAMRRMSDEPNAPTAPNPFRVTSPSEAI